MNTNIKQNTFKDNTSPLEVQYKTEQIVLAKDNAIYIANARALRAVCFQRRSSFLALLRTRTAWLLRRTVAHPHAPALGNTIFTRAGRHAPTTPTALRA